MDLIHLHVDFGGRRNVELWHGDAADWAQRDGLLRPDLVFTNPYGPMPTALAGLPMILHQWSYRKHEAERFAHIPQGALDLIGTWNDDRESFWGANLEETIAVDVAEFRPEPGGWYPLELPTRLLQTYARPGQTIWDGFMGRGTVAKACRALGLNYVGVEQLRAHVDLALDYLELKVVA